MVCSQTQRGQGEGRDRLSLSPESLYFRGGKGDTSWGPKPDSDNSRRGGIDGQHPPPSAPTLRSRKPLVLKLGGNPPPPGAPGRPLRAAAAAPRASTHRRPPPLTPPTNRPTDRWPSSPPAPHRSTGSCAPLRRASAVPRTDRGSNDVVACAATILMVSNSSPIYAPCFPDFYGRDGSGRVGGGRDAAQPYGAPMDRFGSALRRVPLVNGWMVGSDGDPMGFRDVRDFDSPQIPPSPLIHMPPVLKIAIPCLPLL